MATITLNQKEYRELKSRAEAYDRILSAIKIKDIFTPPTTKSRKKIISEFKKTKLYNKKFIDSLEKGLKRSTYFK